MSIYRRYWHFFTLIGVIAVAVTISFIRHEPIRYVDAAEVEPSPAMTEQIQQEDTTDQIVLLEEEDWTYAYYRRAEQQYETVSIQVVDSDTHYTVNAVVDHAADENFVDTEVLVRFKSELGKKVQIGETQWYSE